MSELVCVSRAQEDTATNHELRAFCRSFKTGCEDGPKNGPDCWGRKPPKATSSRRKRRPCSSGLEGAWAALLLLLLIPIMSVPLVGGILAVDLPAPASKEKPFASMINFALVDGKAQLACDIRAPTQDDSVALVLWYKDDSLAPIYTIDARKVNSLERAKISVDDRYSGRLTFNGRSRPAQLELNQVRPEDEGEYRCRVDFKRGRTVNTVISLGVIVPVNELSLFMLGPGRSSGQPLDEQDDGEPTEAPHNRSLARLTTGGLVGPLNEGQPLELLCVARGGKPRPELSWRRDFSTLNSTAGNSFASLDKDATSLALRIDALQRQHLLSIFTCQASNNNLTSPLQSSLTLDLNLKPKDVLIRQVGGRDAPLQVGETVTFECVATGSRPPAVVHWLFQNQRHDSPMTVDQQQTTSRLSLLLQRSFNQQLLACVAENPKIGSSESEAKRTTIKLDVTYPPQLSVHLERRDEPPAGPRTSAEGPADEPVGLAQESGPNLQEGNDVYLSCRLDANPRPPKPIVWRFNGRQLAHSSNLNQARDQQHQGTIVINNNSLVLRKVSRQQAGAYACEATNQLGTNTSRAYELVIKHAPVCKTDDILVYEASLGQVVSIDCQVRANPARSVQFSWFVSRGSNQSLAEWLQREATLDEQLDDVGQQLKFRLRSPSDFALIKCKAKNEIGLQQRVCLFQVVPAGEPELRHSCALAGVGGQTLGLACRQNEHLKTDQLQQQQQRPSDQRQEPSWSWVRNYEAMRQSLAAAAAAGGSSELLAGGRWQQAPRLRQIYPPDWLLVEVHRAAIDNAPARNDTDDASYELQSYLIVGPNAAQLGRVKALVEENKLFQERPRDIYYVASKSWANSTTSTALNGQPNDEPAEMLIQPAASQTLEQSFTISKEAELSLAREFNFSVPNLEPATRYKLAIFGQNLANRTRDFLVLRAETKPGPLHERPDQAAQKAVKNLVLDQQLADRPEQAGRGQSNATGKAIVMRSDGAADEPDRLEDGPEAPSGEPRGKLSRSDRPAAESNELADKLLLRIHHYKNQALAYARRSPLVSIPLALATCCSVLLMLAYLGHLFVRRGRASRHAHSTSDHNLNDSSNMSSTDSTTSRASSTPLQANGLVSSKAAEVERLRQDEKCGGGGDSKGGEDPYGQNEANGLHQAPFDNKLQLAQHCDNYQQHSFSSSGGRDSFSANLENPYNLAGHHHHESLPFAWDCLSAAALDAQQHALPPRPNWQDQLALVTSADGAGGQMLGSLDRRGHFHPTATIYLAPDSLDGSQPGEALELGGILQQQQQQRGAAWREAHKQLATGGSIDRRSYATLNEQNGFTQVKQDRYQSLFLADDLDEQRRIATATKQNQRTLLRSSKCSLASTQHRVAFDLSNQQRGEQRLAVGLDHEGRGDLLQLNRAGRPNDSSSGSNNSTAANTADSGHESPATTGGETNSYQSQQPAPRGLLKVACQRHSQLQRPGANALAPDSASGAGGCSCRRPGQRQAPATSQLMLMEFASPSSQESNSTAFLQSADSSLDANHHLQSQHLDTPTAAYLLRQDCRMATSFVGGEPADDGSSRAETSNWL